MGGGNGQKSAAARLKNMKDVGKTDAERKAASAKAAADSQGFMCGICKSTFMINVKPPTLYLHVTSKHPADTDPVTCFPSLKDFDPEDPKGLKKAAEAAKVAAAKPVKKKKGNDDIDLLSLGLNTKKKGGKKK